MTVKKNQNIDPKTWLGSLFSQSENSLNGHSNRTIAKFRKTGYQEFNTLEFPTRRDEDWKYTSVAPIVRPQYQEGKLQDISAELIDHLSIPNLDAYQFVFVNGNLMTGLSDIDDLPAGIALQSLQNALEISAKQEWIEKIKELEGGTDKNTFLPFNQAFGLDGLVIETAKDFILDKPLHFLYISTCQEEVFFAHPQLYIRANEGSEFTFVENFQSADDELSYFNNAVNYVDVRANAKVNHYRIQNESDAAFQVNNTLVAQQKDSVYSSYVADIGGSIVRNNLSTELQGSNTLTNYYGVYLGDDSQHIDNQTFIDHALPFCNSNEHYKGILTDRAKGVFNGKVMVRQDAQKTNAFQQNSSLVLSDTAVMDAKPQLEIYADDVKCSHGATIGQLDEASIFYLKSRGIPEQQAKNLLQQAFLGEVVMEFKIEEIKNHLKILIDSKLDKVKSS